MSDRTIPSPINTEYLSEEMIILSKGFEVSLGAEFLADIDTFPIQSLDYRYFLTDHLGNIRTEFKDDGNGNAIAVSNHNYYSFGMSWEDETGSKNNYLYNGKEVQKSFDLGYLNYGARFFDPSVGRFMEVDPLADAPHLVSYSPYHYSYNNPINYIDPDGRSPIKGLKALFNVGRRAYKTYKKTGKVNLKTIGKGLKDEALNLVDQGATLLDGQLNADDAFAILEIVTGFGDDAKKLLKGADKVGDATKNRVKLRKGTKEQIKADAPKTADGDFLDPNTGQVIPKDGPYDIGHKTGQEWRTRKKMHQEKGSTRKEVIEAENNPNLYQIEDRSSNRSHKYEKKD